MSKKYQVIVADIPWSFSDQLNMSDVKRGAKANYSTMAIEDIKKLPIEKIADANGCLLALWVPSSLLREGIEVMEDYGFHLKTTYIWVKQKKNPFAKIINNFADLFRKKLQKENSNNPPKTQLFNEGISNVSMNDMLSFGMGHLLRGCHEICLIGTNSNKIYQQLQNRSQRTVSFAPNLKHSAKPENLQDSLELMFPNSVGKRLEIFGRRLRPGWDVIGNESPSTLNEDIFVSLQKLIDQ